MNHVQEEDQQNQQNQQQNQQQEQQSRAAQYDERYGFDDEKDEKAVESNVEEEGEDSERTMDVRRPCGVRGVGTPDA